MSLFYFFGGDGTDRAGQGGGCIPRRWRPQTPAHPDRLHTTGSRAGRARCKADHARHDTRAKTLDTLHRSALDTRPPTRADRNGAGRWRALSSSETVQIWTHSNMNDFQHKNVCKTIDTNTRMCYYVDNTRTCYTTTKTGGQNHEKGIQVQ